ncbi:SirB1 family protein [Bowmanella denitrificans]|uniref:SirB1 family protein n=1 Tax=Bowmanella denitrificans TaxID=366582 RepID=A0ABP3GVY7_9ALTE
MSPVFSSIAQEQPLKAALQLGLLFGPVDVDAQIRQVHEWIELGRKRLTGPDPFGAFLHFFYKELAFGQGPDIHASNMVRMDQVLAYRSGGSICLGLLFCYMGRQLGFELTEINFPGHFLISRQKGALRRQFIDPLNGKILNWQQVEALYHTLLDDMHEEDDESQLANWLQPGSCRDIVVRLLNNLKATFIQEQRFEQAWQASDLLVQLCPDDPYERRDRGFLLQQLDCPGGALADYRYYISQCPRDPAAQLLKMQLKHFTQEFVVLH